MNDSDPRRFRSPFWLVLPVVVGLTPVRGGAQESPPAEPPQPPRKVIVVPAAPRPTPSEPAPGAPPAADAGWALLETAPPEDRQERRQLVRRNADGRKDLLLGYREVLELLGAGRVEDAQVALATFERGAMVGREPTDLQRLFQAEVEAIRWLGGKDVECLVPVLSLHYEAFTRYVAAGEPFLAGHASRITASLADVYAREGGTEGSRVLGARALAALGIRSQHAGMKNESVALMVAALAHDPKSDVALLGLAAAHERHGGYQQAVGRLEELLAAHPGHAEGRLRLAVNLARLGKPKPAEELLTGLIADPRNDWVTAVAFEEVGRLYRTTERLEAAEKVLTKGLQRLPANGPLRAQLALVRERRNDPVGALDLVSELPALAEQTAPNPSGRWYYSRGPQETFARAEGAIAESAGPRVRRLGLVLASTHSGAGTEGERP